MSIRYLSNITLALIGGFLVVASQAFTNSVFASLALAGGAAVIALLAIATAAGQRGIVQRGMDAISGALGVGMIVASLVFAASTFVWLGLGASLAIVALAVTGLTLHELKTERVVHSLELREQPIGARNPVGGADAIAA
jgi:hypothetical protein